jgi:replicative DNA helicase
MDAVAHGRVVLSAVLANGGSVRALDYASSHIGEDHFTDPVQRSLFTVLTGYARQAGGILTREALGDLLRGKKPGTVQMYEEAYDAIAAALPELHQFRHSVDQLRELAAERATGEALATAMQILRDGVRDDDGRELAGHADAREFAQVALAEAEQLASTSDTPEGNVNTEGDEVLAAYAAAKVARQSGKPVGVQFGLPDLDHSLGGGLGKGLTLVVAATTVGKSSLCVQCAWHNAVEEGRDVTIFTTEQHRDEVRAKMFARHSRLSKFGLGRGLDTLKIVSGWLSEEEERALAWVADDLKTCPDYGEIQVVQMPEHCTVPVWTGRAEAMARRRRPALMIFDYLQLCDPAQRGRDSKEHETQAGIVKGSHRWAQTAFHGHGVSLVSPWQANQGGSQALRGSGGFSLDQHMSQSSEAGKTAATVLSLSLPEEDTSHGRAVPLVLTVEKNRNGVRGGRFRVTADYATSYFTDRVVPEEDPIDFGDE